MLSLTSNVWLSVELSDQSTASAGPGNRPKQAAMMRVVLLTTLGMTELTQGLFKNAPFRNNDHVTWLKRYVFLSIGARLVSLVIEVENSLVGAGPPADLYPSFGGVWPKPTCKGDRLDQSGGLTHIVGAWPQNFASDKDFGLEILFRDIRPGGISQRNGDVEVSIFVVAL